MYCGFESCRVHKILQQNLKNLITKIPKEVSHVTDRLEKAGFEAYLVGGCVRDLLMDKKPKDWDIATNAKPEQIISLFEKTVYKNTFGTVGIVISADIESFGNNKKNVSRETSTSDVIRETLEYKIIEVTSYRIETKYSDFRHPDEIKFSNNIEDDLKRRDFTINAMAFRNGYLTDMFKGLTDIKDKTLRTVGSPDDRFQEDALRMLRAVRFACQLDFSVSYETMESIFKNANLIKEISVERIHDEFVKIIMSSNPASGIMMLQKFNLLKNIIPELEEEIGCEQSGEHIYDVWNHSLHALQHATEKSWPLEVRLAALFHDIGKPRARRIAEPVNNLTWSGRGRDPENRGPDKLFTGGAVKKKFTFYGHEIIGARIGKKIMERLKFPRKEIDLVEKLIRNHMFFSDTELITLSAVRRIIAKVSSTDKILAGKKENHPIWDLMKVRECDRVGMKKKEAPYRLRKYFAMIEEALRDPISVSQLKINGEFMIKELEIKPGPRMGWILHTLLEEVLDAPEKNTKEHLSELAKSLNMLGDAELKILGLRGKEKKEEFEEEEVKKLHLRHGVD